MEQILAGFPVGGTTSATLTFTCRARANAGIGSYSSVTPVPFTDLAIVFPTGRDEAKSLVSLRDTCVMHLLNNPSFVAWWNPPIGTLEGNLRAALESCQAPHSYETTRQWMLLFDGQFGSVLAA